MAQRFYEGQTLTIKLETSDSDLANATLKEIRTVNPDGIVVNNTATITATSKLEITLASSVIIKGDWSVHAYAEFGATIKKGRTFNFEIFEVFE